MGKGVKITSKHFLNHGYMEKVLNDMVINLSSEIDKKRDELNRLECEIQERSAQMKVLEELKDILGEI